MLRALIWPLAFAAMDDAGAAAFRAWPQIKSVSHIAATAIVTDHPWPLNFDSGAVRPYHDVWDKGKLDQFITNPDAMVRDNKMKPYGGLASPETRAKVIAYLESVATSQ